MGNRQTSEPGSLIVITLLAAVMSSGCFRAEAKTPAAAPALETPEPPSRLVIPVLLEAPPVPPAPTPAPTPTPRPTPAATGGRGTAPPPTAPPATTTPPTDPPPTPPVLQPNASLEDLERRAKDRLERAEKDLGQISESSLGKNAREQFASAKRFARQAREAIDAKNFVFALYCADKALTLASLLK